jgi:hypothetical protein
MKSEAPMQQLGGYERELLTFSLQKSACKEFFPEKRLGKQRTCSLWKCQLRRDPKDSSRSCWFQ